MSALESLVVVDADPRSRDAVAFGFEREGCVVHATADAREAVALAETGVPQVLVASTAVIGMEAPSLVKAVRAGRRGDEIGVVVIGDEAARDATLAVGADDFLARPAFIRDVVTMAKLAALRSDGEVRGQLAEYGLFFLTRALSAARQSGVVTLERPRRAGEMTFDRGELQSARVGKQNGANAFHQLLLWDRATLHVRFGLPAATPQKKIQKPIERLLEDGARFVTEFEAIAERVGGPKVVYSVDQAKLASVRRQVPPEVGELLADYDGLRTLIDVVEDSPFKPFDTIMITHRLIELGALIRRAEAPPSTLSASLAVKDWLLGNTAQGSPSVSASEEVGRVVADALARGEKSAPRKKEASGPVAAKTPAGPAPIPERPRREPPSGVTGSPRSTLRGMPTAQSMREAAVPSAPRESRPSAQAPPSTPREAKPAAPTVAREAKPAAPTVAREAKPAAPTVARDAKPVAPTVPREAKPAAPTVAREAKPAAPTVPREAKPAAPVEPARPAPSGKVKSRPAPAPEKVPAATLPSEVRRNVVPPILPEEPERPTVPRAAPSLAAHAEEDGHKHFLKLDPAAIERALASDGGQDTMPFERLPDSEVPPVRPPAAPISPVALETAITAPKQPRSSVPFAPVPFEAAVTSPKRPRREAPPDPLPSVIIRPDTGAVPRVAEAAPAPREATGRHARSAFDALEEEFFAREADLHQVEPVDTFDDLDAPAPSTGKPKSNGSRKKR